ncbi:pyruvate dehydrogenase complex dihydrolipoamide acetyltransferase [Bacillus subtilis]|uniref:pyruvate dehydrogenase complex dihydrolipoamide acetyltransferase n=1 Tax=Pseudochrobactrum asaccharolyticum TaxID=354351 RepID=UPI001F01964B|nr:pyruvate dehydrogenase complex dihydrolipoamide acetyltransferase [Pseudochrobactrum asaccharolyticum]MCF7645618.1 pyruvate dehydrogenase complex dihydrolipoamide acetyltransferase [Pseudochrobactrum asaccharolyticum]MCF7671317.1 pyruvate dehydrogenase complex dihydrolipoamide acetyltransferase [Bacillus subtilis]
MAIKITMPALSPTMEEGNLAKWLVKEGDKVSAGDVIAEIETDKATMEVEAVDEGIVAKLVVAGGTEGVKVNALIAVLAEDGEDVAEAAKAASGDAPAAAPKAEAAPAAVPAPVAAAPAATPAPAAPAPVAAPAAKGERLFASPLARRIAKEAGVELSAVSGTGPHGRIIRKDVETAIASGVKAPAAATPSAAAPQAAVASGASDEATLKMFEEGSYELVPHDGMRKTIARRLMESKLTVPHFYLTIDCELDALLALRAQLNAAAPVIKTEKGEVPAYKLSVNDLVIKATALALRDIPEANVSWTDAGMVKHKHSDVGVAVSIPGGLITPIVRGAETKALSAISNEMKDLAKRARDRKLKPSEYQGGTTSVSNLGMFGVKDFAAIINPPHATIFAVGAGEQRAVVKNGELAVANVMSVTLSTDHRAVDGALAAELAKVFKNYIENPLSLLV